jgi:hypothetical protein
MVFEILLYQLRPEVGPEAVDDLMRQARSQLLRVPQVLSVRAGKALQSDSAWPFVVALEFDTRARQVMAHDDPYWLKFTRDTMGPQVVVARMAVDYELEPGRDVRHS